MVRYANNLDVWSPMERDAWRVPGPLKPSECAEGRILTAGAAKDTLWRNDKAPYLTGIMDSHIETETKEITIMGPAQCGKSEGVYNMIRRSILCAPADTMYVGARIEEEDYYAKERIGKMILANPDTRRFTSGRAWDMSSTEIKLDNMTIYVASAGSAAGLASKPIMYLYLDETDKYKLYIGNEGSPAALAKRRTMTFADAKTVYLCTPTTTDGFIWMSWHRSNMQKYYVPCPRCGGYQSLRFANLKIEPADMRDIDYICENDCVYYQCIICRGRINSYEKTDIVAAGLWLPEGVQVKASEKLRTAKSQDIIEEAAAFKRTGASEFYESTGKPLRTKRHQGFWIGGLVSPWLYWNEILAEFFEANRDLKIDPGKMREFKNQVLAQAHEESGEKLDDKELPKLIGEFSRSTVPAEALILVASADYHEDERGFKRIDYAVKAFGYDMRNWTIKNGSVSSWDELDEEVLLSPFPWSDATPPEKRPWLAVMLMFVDSRYKPDEVYAYCSRRGGLTYPAAGATTINAPPLKVTALEKTTSHTRKYRGITRFEINTNFFKDLISGLLRPVKDKDGNIIELPKTQFYSEISQHSDYYFKELSNEQKVLIKSGRNRYWAWQPVYEGAPTHSLDLEVMCAAAGYQMKVQYLRPPGYQKPAAAGLKKKIPFSQFRKQRQRVYGR